MSLCTLNPLYSLRLFIFQQHYEFPSFSVSSIAFPIENAHIIWIDLNVGVTSIVFCGWNFYLFVECHDSLIRSANQHNWLSVWSLNVFLAFEAYMSLSMIDYLNVLLSASKTSRIVESRYRVVRFIPRLLCVFKVYLFRNIDHFSVK